MGSEVSVVIPTYNRSALLRNAVDSVLAQDTQVPFEIVIVDNNSQDDTAAVVRSLTDGRVRVTAESRLRRPASLLSSTTTLQWRATG
jgi:glycosyltransferase involved in cell wall biosynthesis